jgi:hypothetical protein
MPKVWARVSVELLHELLLLPEDVDITNIMVDFDYSQSPPRLSEVSIALESISIPEDTNYVRLTYSSTQHKEVKFAGFEKCNPVP